tara:strand:+ start:472 stop:678 length:207 start_codon:yes stop_codon:yes gene_type:complete
MPKKQISFRLEPSVYKAACKRAKSLGFPSVANYLEALIQCDENREFQIQITHAKGGVDYKAIDPGDTN